jgi:hypothetical protein
MSVKYLTNLKNVRGFKYSMENSNSNHRRDINATQNSFKIVEKSKSDIKVDNQPEFSNELSQVASKLKSKE